MSSLVNSKDSSLLLRLRNELSVLQMRRNSILSIAQQLKNSSISDNLSIAYLIEVASRPIEIV